MELYDLIAQIQGHIETLNSEMGNIQTDVAVLKSQMSNIVWWFRTVVGAFIAMVIAQIWQIKLIKKNNK